MSELTLDDDTDPAVSAGEALHPDPITGEPGAHPVAVGAGALGGAGAGALVGAFAGPIGAVIGAAIGAIAGGVVGHEAAVSSDAEASADASTGDLNPEATGSVTETSGRPSSVAAAPDEETMVFPGSDLGAPAVTMENDGGRPPLGSSFLLGTASAPTGEREAFAPADEAAGHSFSVGGDPSESVRMAAYYRYLDRLESGRPGDELGDWVEAEREVSRF